MHEARQVAEEAAREGAAVLLDHLGHITQLRTKSAATDMVSAADIASGVAVVQTIASRIPAARFVVEEPEVYELAGVERGMLDDANVWVIDPLDGTTSFVHNYPCWSVSIACLRLGQPVAAAVYNVPADEMFSAALGSGATLNDTPLTCQGSPTIEGALLATGFPYDRGVPFDRQLRLIERLVRRSHDVRRDGSAAVDLCHVAANRTDGFWETSLQPWDMAAGMLVVEEAGGIVTDFHGQSWTVSTRDVLAANPELHAELLRAINDLEGA